MEIMIQLIEQHVQHVMDALVRLGYFSDKPKHSGWSIHFDGALLKSLGFRAAATMSNGTPVMVLPEDFKFPEELNVITHEAIHLAQIIKGSMVIIPGSGLTEWEGIVYNSIPADSEEYFSGQPWEQEALDIEPKVHKDLARLFATQ